jgi:hypothetical protein
MRPIDSIYPSPENELIYRPVSPDDPEILELARSIETHGLQQPLTVTRDGYIISGHRRYAALRLLGVREVPCHVNEDVSRFDPNFEALLRENNRQRVKSLAEVIREQTIDIDPDVAYSALVVHRKAECAVNGEFIAITGTKTRKVISAAKRPMLDRVLEIIMDQRAYWPLSDRSIHYDVLNDPPLRHASKPESRYVNDPNCYKDLTDLLTRARLAGLIPFEAIADPTRTVQTWNIFDTLEQFVDREVSRFLKNYFRNYMLSQPNHIEIIGEKNTVEGSIKSVAMKYCIPYTIGRGYCSLDPRYKMAKRFKASGKGQLIVLALSDFDPDGIQIAHGFARSMRDDFGIRNILAKSVCLTWDQVRERDLAQTFDLTDKKRKQAKFQAHLARYGEHFHELEALPSAERSRLLEEAILGLLDVDAFNAEVDIERAHCVRLTRLREQLAPILREALADGESD